MPPTIHTVTHPLNLGDFSHRCAWCPRVCLLKYEELVDADGRTIIDCLCNVCAGTAMVANNKQPATEQEGTPCGDS